MKIIFSTNSLHKFKLLCLIVIFLMISIQNVNAAEKCKTYSSILNELYNNDVKARELYPQIDASEMIDFCSPSIGWKIRTSTNLYDQGRQAKAWYQYLTQILSDPPQKCLNLLQSLVCSQFFPECRFNTSQSIQDVRPCAPLCDKAIASCYPYSPYGPLGLEGVCVSEHQDTESMPCNHAPSPAPFTGPKRPLVGILDGFSEQVIGVVLLVLGVMVLSFGITRAFVQRQVKQKTE
eukprot:gb/GECH01014184.1/.p1 GENE.gb/GECH01014184.1/~~gb/GECH01014184.1/.p1  ORF type:complete len:235 (+),score=21.91 gb/GECH01014184.1/:1-705(+)